MSTHPSLRRRLPGWLVLFLAGPVIWYLTFWLVYLVAEAGCTTGGLDFRLLGLPGLSVITVTVSVLAAGTIAVLTTRAYMRWSDDPSGEDHRRSLMFAGFLLGILFLIATLFIALPALVLEPC